MSGSPGAAEVTPTRQQYPLSLSAFSQINPRLIFNATAVCSIKKDEIWKIFPYVLCKVSLSSTPWVLKCAGLAFCLSGVWCCFGGWEWGFFVLVVEWNVFFILNNRLCKSFSWLLYLEFSYINCFPHTSSSSSPCWRTESQEISGTEKRLNWVWVLCSIAHPLPLWNSFSNYCHVWSKWHQCFHLGFFLPCVFCPWDNISCLLSRHFVICSRIKMAMLDIFLPFHPVFWKKKSL